jgi:hypothetical protein
MTQSSRLGPLAVLPKSQGVSPGVAPPRATLQRREKRKTQKRVEPEKEKTTRAWRHVLGHTHKHHPTPRPHFTVMPRPGSRVTTGANKQRHVGCAVPPAREGYLGVHDGVGAWRRRPHAVVVVGKGRVALVVTHDVETGEGEAS